ncbi:hypothetical protein [Pseudomonas putida]|uniref:hypothetical protein n=1 Tax=Pseudomonas putida TaxID=303 RepID=UPI0023642E8F|nr:hypothetical protein [Pseudomonas putida]MDD2144021.1 hypothetical protein [Pseudomonas putida]HDS1707194.1 hypothetical protein [Pseudomonas putida]
MSETIYLEVRKGDGAILSYFNELPETKSSHVDYVQATMAELTYLSALEDYIFPVGTVAQLSDLLAFRERVSATQKASAITATAPNKNAPQRNSGASSKAEAQKQKSTKFTSTTEFLKGFKKVRKNAH